MMRDMTTEDRAEVARLRAEQDEHRRRGFFLAAKLAQEEIDAITGEGDD